MNAPTKTVLAACALALSVLAVSPAMAADPPPPLPAKYDRLADGYPSFYMAARVGAGWNDDTEFNIPLLVTNEYNAGLNVSVAIGRGFDLDSVGMRAELEVGYLTSDIDTHTVATLGTFTGGAAFGDTSALYGLANAYFDFDNWGGAIMPYISAGLGVADVDFDGHGVTPAGVVMNDNATGFAWQVGTGFSYDVNDSLALEVGYRYFNVESIGLTSVGGVDSDIDLRAHQVNAGLRYRF